MGCGSSTQSSATTRDGTQSEDADEFHQESHESMVPHKSEFNGMHAVVTSVVIIDNENPDPPHHAFDPRAQPLQSSLRGGGGSISLSARNGGSNSSTSLLKPKKTISFAPSAGFEVVPSGEYGVVDSNNNSGRSGNVSQQRSTSVSQNESTMSTAELLQQQLLTSDTLLRLAGGLGFEVVGSNSSIPIQGNTATSATTTRSDTSRSRSDVQESSLDAMDAGVDVALPTEASNAVTDSTPTTANEAPAILMAVPRGSPRFDSGSSADQHHNTDQMTSDEAPPPLAQYYPLAGSSDEQPADAESIGELERHAAELLEQHHRDSISENGSAIDLMNRRRQQSTSINSMTLTNTQNTVLATATTPAAHPYVTAVVR